MWRSSRRLLIALALGAGLAITAGLVAFDRLARGSLEREALLEQAARAGQLADQLQIRLETAEQVARTVAALATPLQERAAVETLIQSTLVSTPPEYIYGIGVWFGPYALEPEQRWVGPYAHRELGKGQRVVLTYEWSTPAYDYFRHPWYQQGLQAGERPSVTEPYFDVDFVYSTIALAFRGADGEPRGVVTVDIIHPQLQALVARANTSPHETFYAATRAGRLFAHPQEESLLAWAKERGRAGAAGVLSELRLEDLRAYEQEHGLAQDRHTQTAVVGHAGWTVYVSTDKDRLFAASRRLHTTLQVVGLSVWAVLLAALVAGLHKLRIRALSSALSQQQRERLSLERSERMLREVLETSMDGVAAVDSSGRLVEWNTSAERIFGWGRRDVLGHLAVELLCRPEDQAERDEQLQRVIQAGRLSIPPYRLEAQAVRRDGEVFPVETSLAAVPTGGAHRVYAFFSDITGRHRAEEERQRLLERQRALLSELRQRSAELQAIIDNMVEGVFVASPDGQFSFVNQAGLRMYGGDVASTHLFTLQTLEGTPVPPDALPLSRALRGEVVLGSDFRAPRTGGDMVLRINAAPIPDEEGRVAAAVAVAHDITEAVEFDRLKDEFVRMAAHELKTPVAVMKSFAQLALKTELGRNATHRRLLEGVERGANRIDQVVRTLLDVSQLHLGRMRLEEKPLELRELVEKTARRMGEARPEHPVHVHADEEAPVRGDPARLEQVLVALLDNAMRYSPPSAPVEVMLSTREDEVEVAIRDRGIGIPADKQARLFHRFYRPHAGTAHDQGGLGVGLYIARAIVHQHGGQLTLESREGQGTTVHLRLPLHTARARTGAHPAPAGQEGAAP